MTAFLDQLEVTCSKGGYVAIIEVCGFNDWFVECLRGRQACQNVVIVQSVEKSRRKTDRRDAAKLSELLWTNRERIQKEQPIHGIRRMILPNPDDQEARKLTGMRQRLRREQSKVITRIKSVLRNCNLFHRYPTKGVETKTGFKWLKELAKSPEKRSTTFAPFVEGERMPSEAERLELKHLMRNRAYFDKQVAEVDRLLDKHTQANEDTVTLLTSMPGCGVFTALVFLSSIGDIQRFKSARSLGNYFGLTPTSNNSGEATNRLGNISKEGRQIVRYVLGLMVTTLMRRDPWMKACYRRIKKKSGAKKARVAVMRRVTVILYHMLTTGEPYIIGGPDAVAAAREAKAAQTALPADSTTPGGKAAV